MSAAKPWTVVVDLLERAGIEVVFGLPADDVSLLAALDQSGIRLVICRDQRSAAFAATGYALQSGRPGVCFVGKGPALTNTVTGILEAQYASAPLVVIAAGTDARSRGTGALQEADQLGIIAPLVSWARRVEAAERLAPDLDEALLVAAAGAQEPVYLELPDHLLETECSPLMPGREPAVLRVVRDEETVVARVRQSRRPVLLVGGGMRHRNQDRVLERLAERLDAPVFVTASGRGAFDEASPLFCGVAGLYSPPEMKTVWDAADLVLVLGSRLEETAVEPVGFASRETDLVQINLRKRDFDASRSGVLCLADAEHILLALLRNLPQEPSAASDWGQVRTRAAVAAFSRWHAESAAPEPTDVVSVPTLLGLLDEMLPPSRILVQENGLADMWPYFFPAWTVEQRAGSVVPSEQTTLGFGAAAAAGVALADPERPVVALVGDGAFEMVRNDIVSFAEEGIPVLYIVLRNGGYGWLQTQLEQTAPGRSGRHAFLRRGSRGGHSDDLRTTVVDQPAHLAVALADAVEATLAGRTCVVDVLVAADEGPLHPARETRLATERTAAQEVPDRKSLIVGAKT